MQLSVIFMGRRISEKGIQPTDDKVEAKRKAPSPHKLRSWLGIWLTSKPSSYPMVHPLNMILGDVAWQLTDAIKAPIPHNVTELRSWLGMVNLQAKFLPNLSTMVHPLNTLLGDVAWQWTDACDIAMKAVKDAISSDKLLARSNATT